MRLEPPTPLAAQHDLAQFDCGKPALNEWLSQRGWSNHQLGYTKVIVVANGTRVVGYYGLSVSSVERSHAPRSIRPHPAPQAIPCLLLGQLAVDRAAQHLGIGAGLLKDAYQRTLDIAALAGTRALVVNALDLEAGAFWKKQGFTPSASDPQTYFISIAVLAASASALASVGLR